MRHIYAAALAALILAGFSGATSAHEYAVGDLRIQDPWARAMPAGAAIGGGYMTIRSVNGQADRLLGGSSPRAARIEVHGMFQEGDVVRMRRVHALEIVPGDVIELRPGGLHLMFVDVTEPFREGERIPATLVFDRAGEVQLEFLVGGIGDDGPDGGAVHDHGGSD